MFFQAHVLVKDVKPPTSLMVKGLLPECPSKGYFPCKSLACMAGHDVLESRIFKPVQTIKKKKTILNSDPVCLFPLAGMLINWVFSDFVGCQYLCCNFMQLQLCCLLSML